MIVRFKSQCFLACSSWWDLSLLGSYFFDNFRFHLFMKKLTAFRRILMKGACKCSPQIYKNKNVCQMETRAVEVSCGFWLRRRNPERFSLLRLTLSFLTFSSFRGTKDPALILSVNDIVGKGHKSPHKCRFLRIFNFSVIFAEFSLSLRLGVIMRVCKV